jgi:hypothetical protein
LDWPVRQLFSPFTPFTTSRQPYFSRACNFGYLLSWLYWLKNLLNLFSIDVILYSGDLATSNDYFEHYYVDPWARAPVYLVGIWFGWYLHVTKESSIRLSKVYKQIIYHFKKQLI